MAENKIFLGKPRSGLGVTVKFAEIKVSMDQIKKSYRDITIVDVQEMNAKAIGFLVK